MEMAEAGFRGSDSSTMSSFSRRISKEAVFVHSFIHLFIQQISTENRYLYRTEIQQCTKALMEEYSSREVSQSPKDGSMSTWPEGSGLGAHGKRQQQRCHQQGRLILYIPPDAR